MDRDGCGEDCDAEGCEGGADGCEECAWWRRHCYWSHAGDHPRQLSIVAGDSFRDHMRIRPPVASHLRNLITEFEEIQLDAPNGRSYPVKIGWEFGDIVLRSGWHDFVKAHHIEQNSSIRFVYRGKSSFEVHISGSSGHDNSSPPPPRDRYVLSEQVVPDPAHVHTSVGFGYTAFPGTWISSEQDKKVRELAQTQSSMRSEFRLHVAAVNKGNANGDCHVYIPLTLLDIFKEGITEAPIQLKAHSKDMFCVVGASKHGDDQIILQSELSRFVDCHRMQDDDLLVFRSKGKAQLEALVLDPSGYEKTCFDMGSSSNAREGCRAQAQNTASTSLRWAKSGLQARESGEAGLEAPRSNNYISTGIPLLSQQKQKVEERVRAIGSEFPVFVKVITLTDVDTRPSLYLGVEYASACLLTQPGRLRLLLDGDERDWDCMLSLRKPTKAWWIDKAWTKFIKDVGLEEHDICLFELTDTGSLTMKVHVIHKSDIRAPLKSLTGE